MSVIGGGAETNALLPPLLPSVTNTYTYADSEWGDLLNGGSLNIR